MSVKMVQQAVEPSWLDQAWEGEEDVQVGLEQLKVHQYHKGWLPGGWKWEQTRYDKQTFATGFCSGNTFLAYAISKHFCSVHYQNPVQRLTRAVLSLSSEKMAQMSGIGKIYI